MKNLMTAEQLIAFEEDVAQRFNNKMIRAPIHLEFNNEKQLISVFNDVNEDDWCFCTWRSHYKCLLKEVNPEELKQAILDGHSISLCFAKQRIFSSAIVGGNLSIALGKAMEIKRRGLNEHCWVFLGEMTSTLGQFREVQQYAMNWDLPITFIIEDNSLSVCTNTREVWNCNILPYEPFDCSGKIKYYEYGKVEKNLYQKVWYYKYNLHEKYKHAGSGVRIVF